jgi:hypothetical protein
MGRASRGVSQQGWAGDALEALGGSMESQVRRQVEMPMAGPISFATVALCATTTVDSLL